MKIAVEGCCHGNLDKIYARLMNLPKEQRPELLLICGDFQAVRNKNDLECMSVPPKYRFMGDFRSYYNGDKNAPILTIFIGGNHEASNYLQELKFGGWVCPNIYYLGKANVIHYNGLSIGGISGVYYKHDFMSSSYEKVPFDKQAIRSVYHTRKFETLKLLFYKKLNNITNNVPLDIFLSHDWPQGIEHHGNLKKLLMKKPFFERDINSRNLGSPSNKVILDHLYPRYWFSAHLHVKYTAEYKPEIKNLILTNSNSTPHTEDKDKISLSMLESDSEDSDSHLKVTDRGDDDSGKTLKKRQGSDSFFSAGPKRVKSEMLTRFLALDKCRPKAQYLEVMDIQPSETSGTFNQRLRFDENFLKINKFFNHITLNEEYKAITFNDIIYNSERLNNFLDKYTNTITEQKVDQQDFAIPLNFKSVKNLPFETRIDTQTIEYCENFGIEFEQDEY